MSSHALLDRDGVMAALDRYRAAVSELVDLSLDVLDVPDLFAVLDATEAARCQVPVIEHRAINNIAAQATPEQIGKSLKRVLADRLRIRPGEARRRIADAHVLAPRRAMTGQPLAPLWAATAAGQRAGEINFAHVAEIHRFFAQLPSWVDEPTRERAEQQLADNAAKHRPDELRTLAEKLADCLNPDGNFTDEDRARARGITLGRQDIAGMSKISGWLTPEARAGLDAVLSKWAAPGMCDPADESPTVDGEPSEKAKRADPRSPAMRNHDALIAMCRSVLSSGELGSHHGLPVSIIVTTTLQDLESAAGIAGTGGGTWLPMPTVIRMASHARHYLRIYDNTPAASCIWGKPNASPRPRNELCCTPMHVTVMHPRMGGMNNTNTATRAVIYARISNDPGTTADDQPRRGGDGLGVARQQEDCRALADQLGWDVVAVHVDNDISAYSGKTRPGFEALLDGMKQGEFDAVLCWHIDRLYRHMKDLERIIEIADAAKVSIRTVQGGEIDLSTSAGRMVARILGSVARQESEHMSERRIRFNQQKAEKGKWQTANRVFGYTMSGEPLEPEATAVRQAVVDVLAGTSIQEIARRWNTAGLKTTLAGRVQRNPHTKQEVTISGQWTGRRVRRLLVNPRYAAIKTTTVRDKKTGKAKVVEYQGDWTPLIDLDTHRGLVGYLSDPSRIKCTSFERKYLGSNLYRCGRCGGPMKAAMPGGAAGRKSRAYACRDHAHVLRQGEPVDDFVTATVLERITQPDAADLLANQGVDIGALSTKREALQRKLDNLTDLFNDDQIDAEQFGKSSRDTRNKLAVIDRQLADATRVSPAAALIAAGANAWQLWQDMSPTQRAQAVDELCVVTILPCPPGQRRFNCDYVDVAWRRGE